MAAVASAPPAALAAPAAALAPPEVARRCAAERRREKTIAATAASTTTPPAAPAIGTMDMPPAAAAAAVLGDVVGSCARMRVGVAVAEAVAAALGEAAALVAEGDTDTETGDGEALTGGEALPEIADGETLAEVLKERVAVALALAVAVALTVDENEAPRESVPDSDMVAVAVAVADTLPPPGKAAVGDTDAKTGDGEALTGGEALPEIADGETLAEVLKERVDVAVALDVAIALPVDESEAPRESVPVSDMVAVAGAVADGVGALDGELEQLARKTARSLNATCSARKIVEEGAWKAPTDRPTKLAVVPMPSTDPAVGLPARSVEMFAVALIVYKKAAFVPVYVAKMRFPLPSKARFLSQPAGAGAMGSDETNATTPGEEKLTTRTLPLAASAT